MLQTARHATLAGRPRWTWPAQLPWWRPPIEPVELRTQRFGYQPRCFRRRGMFYRVYRIERVWEQPARREQAARRYFTVRCNDQRRYTLFQDLALGTWHMVRFRR
jgi:hypothetical protein